MRRFHLIGSMGSSLGVVMAFLCLVAAVPAKSDPAAGGHTLAILPFGGGVQDSVVSPAEKRQLVQTIRGIARRSLPKAEGWSILAGESLEARAPSGTDLSNCSDETCAIATGRKLQVDYVASGNVGRIGPYLEVSISLYNVASGQLVGSEWPRGSSVEDIIDSLNGSPDPLFASLSGSSAGASGNPQTVVAHVYPAGTQVVTYYRRPVYVNPLAWLWIPILVLLFWIPASNYHNR